MLLLFIKAVFGVEGLDFSSQEVVRGESLLVTFTPRDARAALSLRIDETVYYFLPHPKQPRAQYLVVPFDYETAAGAKQVTFEYMTPQGIQQAKLPSIEVLEGDYAFEELAVSKATVVLSPQDRQRSLREYEKTQQLYAAILPNLFVSSGFMHPMETPLTSYFGNARLFNGMLKSYHSGIDFKAAVGTPVYAAASGTVVLNEPLFYAGGCVIVDHGDGVFSSYSHLLGSPIEPGTRIEKGRLIGYSGKSGRVTGPHLHFGMRVLGVKVNPLQLMELLNRL